MRTRTSFVALCLTISLLLAPASFAAPTGHAGLGWLGHVKAFFIDVFDFFRFDEEPRDLPARGDRGTLESQSLFTCHPSGEMDPFPDPSGC